MGILDSLLGNASESDAQSLQQELTRLLGAGEQIQKAYAIFRDQLIFTNKRLILANKQGVTGKKVEYLSIPYRSVERFSMETTGHFDLESELKIWVRGQVEPLGFTFSNDTSIYDVYRTLGEHAL
ncbi:PH domain-containing protein [Hymenobacter sp. GOD-10R]|uniref:PH domain-containing protein n=1 Tax=Hymenobacter sp. GOD-10R TaxID=3093922 RepID=UPI002D79C02A|nr:PH domain-containing protein [Hymenobacter sp. GOD-10R]WRQ27988.1 PH domain-containing protein [Hymenobacter sp. GOD-10R]